MEKVTVEMRYAKPLKGLAGRKRTTTRRLLEKSLKHGINFFNWEK